MPAILHSPNSTPILHFNVHHRPHRAMSLSKLRPLRHLLNRRSLSVAASVRQETDTTIWTPSPLLKISPAAESLFHITFDVSESTDLAASFTKAGQYLQIRLLNSDAKPTFMAIASPPNAAFSNGVLEFLVKSVPGSTAALLCDLQKGDVVELGPIMGKGFEVGQISPPESYQSVLIFATGTGISPVRSLIEEGFSADKRSDVRLYYGARNLSMMAYQERFKEWQAAGVDIVPVLSQPNDSWTGERGYVQAAFIKDKQIVNAQSTGAVLCGQKQMAEEITSALVADGVSTEKILINF